MLDLNDDAHARAVGLVADVGNALQPLVVHLIGHVLDEHALVDLIGKLGDDDARAVAAEFFKFRARAQDDLAAARGICRADAAAAHNDALGREVGARDVLHQVVKRRLGIVEHADAGVDDLGQVVRRDVRRHADGDTRRTVHQQVREARGQHAGLLAALVEVRVPVDGLLVDVAQHFVGDLRHSGLGVSVGGRGVAINGTEVAVAVDEHIAHGEVLRETHERVVHRRVAVRMIAAQHVADAGRRLFERLVARQAVFVHGVQDAAVDRLQAVAHIGQRAPDDDRHRVFDVGGLHLVHELALHDLLVGELNVFGFVIHVFVCHFFVLLS